MAPIFELRPLLAWGGLAKLVRLTYAAAAKAARWLWPPVNTIVAAQHAAVYGFLACIAIEADLFGTDTLLAARLPGALAPMAPVIHLGLAAGWFFVGIAILQYSRVGAMAAFAAYLAVGADDIFTAHRSSHPGAAAITFLLVLMLTVSIRGVFAYHEITADLSGAENRSS